MNEHKQNYLFAKDLLDAISDADRKDEMAQMARLLSIEEVDRIRNFVKLMEDRGLQLTIKRAD